MIAKSFERIHRSNLVGMGIIPLCFKAGEDADTLGLTGHERYTIDLPNSVNEIRPGQDITVATDNGKSFSCTVRFDTEVIKRFNSLFFLLLFIYYRKSLAWSLNLLPTEALVTQCRWSWLISTMEAFCSMSSGT